MGQILFDSRNTEYKRPFGAAETGRKVWFRVFWDKKLVSLRLLSDATKAETVVEMKPGKSAGEWEAEYTFVEKGLYFYRFECGGKYIARKAPGSEGYVSDTPDVDWFMQIVFDKNYRSPSVFRGRVIYQIFPDRFYREVVIYTRYSDRYLHSNLDDMPHFRPVNGVVRNNDYFGGNLRGIEEKLPYLRDLGVGVIYLNPIFESHSNHRYDTADYMKIDPLLGTEEDFVSLCAAAARHGMLIILDGVFSHTGADSVYFDKFGRYGGKTGAFQNADSPYRSWYKFSEDGNGYQAWWGFDTLPEVNEDDPGFLEYICGEGGVIDHWMSLGAGGFRLDVADELPDAFIREIRKAVKRHGSGKMLIGEVWEDASTKEAYGERRQYLLGEELDSVMNYPFREAIIDFARGADERLFMNRVMEVIEHYPKPMMDVMMNLLSTHDTDRLLTALAKTRDVVDREWQARQSLTRDAYLRAVELAKLSFALLFTLPGLPTVYYGDEIGMEGYRDPFNRAYFRWNRMDANIRGYVTEISKQRKKNSAFKDGEILPLDGGAGCAAFIRKNKSNAVLIMVNRSDEVRAVEVDGKKYETAPWRALIETIF